MVLGRETGEGCASPPVLLVVVDYFPPLVQELEIRFTLETLNVSAERFPALLPVVPEALEFVPEEELLAEPMPDPLAVPFTST